MRKIFLLAIMTIAIGCERSSHKAFPVFASNSRLDDLPPKVIRIANDYESSIGYYEAGSTQIGTIKMLAYENGWWCKIEINKGTSQVDTFNAVSGEIQMVHQDVVLRKECTSNESQSFLQKLTALNLFTLEEESVLLDKGRVRCKSKFREFDDGEFIGLWIRNGKKIRKLTFNYPAYRIKDCPEMEEWKNIVAIQDLFKNEWFNKEHWRE